MFISDPLFWLCAIPAVLIASISKGGFAGGLGMLAVPLMALSISVPKAASIMLPILCVMDVVGSWRYHPHWQRDLMRRLLPGAILGIIVGGLSFHHLNPKIVAFLTGVLAILFALQRLANLAPKDFNFLPDKLRATFWSALSGFTSTLTHAGNPPIMVYLLPKKLDKTVLVANLTLYFGLVNFIKLIPYAMLGLLDGQNLATSAALAPVAIIGVYLGIWLHQRTSEKVFYKLCLVFLLLTGLRLVWQAVQ